MTLPLIKASGKVLILRTQSRYVCSAIAGLTRLVNNNPICEQEVSVLRIAVNEGLIPPLRSH